MIEQVLLGLALGVVALRLAGAFVRGTTVLIQDSVKLVYESMRLVRVVRHARRVLRTPEGKA